jgi:hypothetical protein
MNNRDILNTLRILDDKVDKLLSEKEKAIDILENIDSSLNDIESLISDIEFEISFKDL